METKHKDFKSAQTHYQFVLGPIKIKDGLFMGDALAAKDIQFIISNKVTHVINTVAKSVPNLWERFGIQYLSVNWTQNQQNIFDKKNNSINQIYSFVQQAMQQGQSCLIHSLHGKSRACAVMVAYLMKKYQWSLDKCFQYITSKKDHLEVRDNYLSQMQQLQKRMLKLNTLTTGWNQTKNTQQLLLRNTYQNSKAIICGPKQQTTTSQKRVTWGQQPTLQKKSSTVGSNALSSTMTRMKQKNSLNNDKFYPKSILKGEKNTQEDGQSYPRQLKGTIQQKMSNTDNFPMKKDNNFINTINGNIVHVTVNNFITTDKKPYNPQQNKNLIMRPYSSDNKQRQQKQLKANMSSTTNKIQLNKNLFGYDPIYSYNKSPYDTKIVSKLGQNTKIQPQKKPQIRNPIMAFQRPQSANIAGQRRKMMNSTKPLAQQILQKKQDMSIIGKKRYPSTNPREQLYKWK